MEKTDVLVFGTMADIAHTVAENLRSHGLRVASVAFPQNIFRDYSGYRRELLKAIGRHCPNMVIPVGDNLALARIKTELTEDIIVATDTEANISVLNSKVHTYRLAESLGIPQPRLLNISDIPSSLSSFPDGKTNNARGPGQVIFKRDVSFGGSGVHKPKSRKSLDNLIAHESGRPYLIEEFIDGTDLSVDCLRVGDYFRAVCYESLSREYTQGPAVTRRILDCPSAVRYASILLEHIDYQGVCGMDFRIVNSPTKPYGCRDDSESISFTETADSPIFFLECNARFTGGLSTQIANGFEIPFLLYQLLDNDGNQKHR